MPDQPRVIRSAPLLCRRPNKTPRESSGQANSHDDYIRCNEQSAHRPTLTVGRPTVFVGWPVPKGWLGKMHHHSIRPHRVSALLGIGLALLLASCGSGAEDEPRPIGEPWQFGGEVPEGITVPLPTDGEVISSLSMAERTVVMVAFDGFRLAELVAFYDAELSGPDTARSEHTIVAEEQAVWMVRWRLTGLEVRVVECIDLFTREFSQVCVAIDEHTKSTAA